MGRPKPLLPFAEHTAIELLLDALLAGGVAPPVVVLGPGGEAVAAVLAGRPLRLAWNLAEESDMAASLRIGLQAIGAASSAVLIALADHPLVSPATIATLCEKHREAPDLILIPTHDGRKGHPVLFPRPILEELAELPTLRDLVRRDPGRVGLVPVADAGILHDLDTPEDYRTALEFFAGR